MSHECVLPSAWSYVTGHVFGCPVCRRLWISNVGEWVSTSGGEPSELEHADDCDRAIGCTCGTRTIAYPQEEQE